ncbi:Ger(x)C family spore germination protein [Paenibacillus mesophilus]|uniref:Ger(x)C family spore germination protein n=1 Tax=Paenibacillus mesophilus TaxID=2582849 RepID=UPI00110E6A6B|nr:Ger(x)C family spore germination protein [Paenibacillus mesophilus]TMV50008.1 Ger(x)C family spore germination protein [Paenibacillus mesophilus]
MSTRPCYLILLVFAVAVIAGCYDRVDLEEQTSSFLVGIDLDRDNKLVVYASNPVFSSHAEKKSQELGLNAGTLRQSRSALEARTLGFLSYRKVQVILIGKRILEHEDWYRLLDVIMRDTKNPLTQRMVAFNGTLSDIVNLNPKDQPTIPILLRGMVDTKSARSETVKTTFQELDRLFYEKGITPYLSEVVLDPNKEVTMSGTTLLDKKGKYAASLNMPDTVLLHILQNEVKRPVSLTIRIPGHSKSGPFGTDRVSFNAENVKTKFSTSYAEERFKFGIDIRMSISLSERLIPIDAQKEGERLESLIAEQLQNRFESLIRTIQSHRIDPVGLGIYARAYESSRYKDVQDNWGEALAKADINVSVKVTIRSTGPVK